MIVLGTGAAGLTAAVVGRRVRRRVGVFEKADLVGGTTAWSGGQVWIPNNPHMAEVGIADSREQAARVPDVAVAADMIDPNWSRRTSTPARRW